MRYHTNAPLMKCGGVLSEFWDQGGHQGGDVYRWTKDRNMAEEVTGNVMRWSDVEVADV